MKSLDLDMPSLRELEVNEMHSISGGFIPVALAVALLLSAIENFQDIREGFSDGLRRSKSRYVW
jgi:lactobin A/cerein 7B family class IIb bacteriocin